MQKQIQPSEEGSSGLQPPSHVSVSASAKSKGSLVPDEIEERVTSAATAEDAAKWLLIRSEYLRQNAAIGDTQTKRAMDALNAALKGLISLSTIAVGFYGVLHSLIFAGLFLVGCGITLVSFEAGELIFNAMTRKSKGNE